MGGGVEGPEDRGTDLFERLVEVCARQAAALEEMVRAGLGAAAAGPGPDAVPHLRRWVDAASRMPGELAATLRALGEGFSSTSTSTRTRTSTNASTDSGEVPAGAGSWDEHLHRAFGLPPELARRLSRADPERLAVLIRSAAAEYERDLDALGGARGLELDLAPIARALDGVAAGTADDEAVHMVERLRRIFLERARLAAGARAEVAADEGGGQRERERERERETISGQTPRELVHGVGRVRLYRYLGAGPRRGAPVLIVYSLINRPYVLDLLPGYSLIEHLLGQGLDVYLIEWGEGDPRDRRLTLDGYVDPGIRRCVEVVAARTGSKRVSLLGHCIGGDLALLYAATHPGEVARLVTLTTPVAAAKSGVVALWTDRGVFPIEAIIDELGYVPGALIRASIVALKPHLELARWKFFLDRLGDEEQARIFLAADRWVSDTVDLPGEAFRKFAVEVLLTDRFRRGLTVVAGRRADLGAITCPLLNVVASRDWIVPPDSAAILEDLVGSRDRRTLLVEGGHVSLLVDPTQRRHWTTISDFLLSGRAAKPSSRRRAPRR